jgi:hypothetical protein
MQIPQKLLTKMTNYFKGDMVRAKLWFMIPNSVLDDMRPIDYKFNGSWSRLEKMMDDALKENVNE